MTDRYWVRNGAASSAFSTASYWNTAVDGSGSAGVPTIGDDIYIGSPDTLAVGLGNATCVWDTALTVGDFTTYSGYNSATVTSDLISFQAPDIIIHANSNWADLGFREGMRITTSGAADSQNNDTYIIQSIVDNQMTVASGVSNVADEAAGATVTMTCTISLRIEADTTMNKFTLDCTMENTTGGNVTITFSSSYPASSGERYVLNGDNAVINNKDDITYAYNTSTNGTAAMHFDDGPHPKVTVTGASYISPEYKAPTSTLHGETSIHSLSLGASVVFQPNASPTASSTLNASKVFSILTTSTLAIGGSVFDAGFSTFSFTMDATNWTIPVTGDTTYGTAPFKARFYNLIIATPSTAGFKALVPNDRTLSVNSLTVEADAVLKGHATAGDGTTSTICSVSRPRIQGSWNFSQLSDGVYVSLMSDTFPITPSSGPVGRVQFSNAGGTFNSDSKLTWTSATSTFLVDGKLTVTGLIDPTGMVFTPQASNPESTNPEDTIWMNSEDGHLYRGDRDVESTVHFNARNDEGSTIPVGAPLYSKGEIGGSNRIKVGIADASDPNKMPCIGLAMVEMNTTSTKDGNMILSGIFNENVTITGVAEGDTLYVAPHGGSTPYLTTTRPTSGSHLIQNIGICVRQSASNVCKGMTVTAIGRTNDIPNATITTNSADADYVYIDDGNVFKKITPSNLGIGGGGGGSGTVTSVAVSGSDGIQVDSGSPITTSGTIALGVDKNTLLSHINVEDGADVTDATNVTAAGALMDSEVTNLAQVKAFDSADYATAAQGTTADNALPKAGGTMTGEIEATTITLNAVPADPATDDKVRIGESGGSSNMFQIRTNDGYLQMGPNNSGYCHIYTDRSRFYFNREIIIDGGGYLLAYNDGLKLGTGTNSGSGTIAISVADGSTDVEIAGTIKQGASTNAVLVSDANGNIVSAGALADIPYLPQGTAGQDPFNPANPANWLGGPPADIEQAIQRIAQQLVLLGGPIP